ncbi:helix-turn-helix domain-containing protein [candidate division KSB1 bacterium]|nr:helix-turn-helix domain-containing protein [candidate division KSB1 bacterium]
MSKSKLILYSQQLDKCTCYKRILKDEFETNAEHIEKEFLAKTKLGCADVAVICLCSAKMRDTDKLLRLAADTSFTPVLTCSESLDPDFIKLAALHGVDGFLCGNMNKEKIRDLIQSEARFGRLRGVLAAWCKENLSCSPNVRKFIIQIIEVFPQRLTEQQMAKRLAVSKRSIQKLCQEAFGIKFTRLMRRVRVHQALRLMKYTDLDNTDIAVQLNYSDETSMARDFRQELGYNPTQARRRLTAQAPEELLPKVL